MLIELGAVKQETKGQSAPTLFRERGTVLGTMCYHPFANQPDAKLSACWSP